MSGKLYDTKNFDQKVGIPSKHSKIFNLLSIIKYLWSSSILKVYTLSYNPIIIHDLRKFNGLIFKKQFFTPKPWKVRNFVSLSNRFYVGKNPIYFQKTFPDHIVQKFPYLCLNFYSSLELFFKKYWTEFFTKMSQKINFNTLVHKIRQKSKNHCVHFQWLSQ